MIHVWQERKSVLQSVSWDKNQKLLWWLWCWSGTQVKVKAWSQVWSKTKQLVSVFPQFLLHGIQESNWKMSERPGNEVCAPHKKTSEEGNHNKWCNSSIFPKHTFGTRKKRWHRSFIRDGNQNSPTLLFLSLPRTWFKGSQEKEEEAKMKMLLLESDARHHQTTFLSPSLVHQVFLVYTSFFPQQRLAISIIIISTFKLGWLCEPGNFSWVGGGEWCTCILTRHSFQCHQNVWINCKLQFSRCVFIFCVCSSCCLRKIIIFTGN